MYTILTYVKLIYETAKYESAINLDISLRKRGGEE